MSTTIGDLIFDNEKTLFEILDSLDVPRISGQLDATFERLDEVNDQLRQLGSIVDANQANSEAKFIAINTQLNVLNTDADNLKNELLNVQSSITELNTSTGELVTEFDFLELKFDDLDTKVGSFENRIRTVELATTSLSQQLSALTTRVSAIESINTTLSGRITILEANKSRQQFLRQGNEYIFSYRVGNPGNTWYYRITYSGDNTIINAALGYPATVLSNREGTTTSRTVYLTAPFDTFSASGRYNYPMIQGPCQISFTVNENNPTLGYITVL